MFFNALMAFLLLPGIFAGVLPIYLGFSDPEHGSGSFYGMLPVLTGLFLLLCCVREFYISGKGSLAPWNPPENLVSGGLYQYTRNPMYLAVLTIILGWAILFQSPWLIIYLFVLSLVFHLRVIFNEEAWLAAEFGDEFIKYKSIVPRWLPRIKPLIDKILTVVK